MACRQSDCQAVSCRDEGTDALMIDSLFPCLDGRLATLANEQLIHVDPEFVTHANSRIAPRHKTSWEVARSSPPGVCWIQSCGIRPVDGDSRTESLFGLNQPAFHVSKF